MCGIVGLLVKNPALRGQLGELMLPMLIGMAERGPESAGLAVFTAPIKSNLKKLSLYSADPAFDWDGLDRSSRAQFGKDTSLTVRSNQAVLETGADATAVKLWLKHDCPEIHVLSVGKRIDLYKDTGTPGEVAERYRFSELTGTHLVGHTRMATETAVTPERAHPFTAGEDFCLVHNGSLSNACSIRRKLEPLGIAFETDNDTEAACRFLEWRMREGDGLEAALHKGFEELDGFYTFLMGTQDELALVRDAFSCKPAVVAESDDYVAIASEFRSLAKLPGVKNAHIFEPNPEQVYIWRT